MKKDELPHNMYLMYLNGELEESIARDLKAKKDPKSILEGVRKLMVYDGVGYAHTAEVWESAEANFDLYINEYNEAALFHVEHDLIRIAEREKGRADGFKDDRV